MSILLESLDEQPTKKNGDVPNIHESHFNDELLGDEWLLQRIKKWKIISAILFTMLILNWLAMAGYFIYFFQKEISLPVVEQKNATDIQVLPITSNANSLINKNKLSIEQTNLDNTVNNQKLIKEEYTPQKRNIVNTSEKKENDKVNKNNQVTKPAKNSENKTAVLSVDDLPQDLKSKFPVLKIDSYVVADKKEESFVILDGSFYSINQVISPNLILREIDKDKIIVEFHSQRVKIPFN